MYIKQIFDFINFLKSQNQGRGISAPEFTLTFNDASFSLWRKLKQKYEVDRTGYTYLKNFEIELDERPIADPIPAQIGMISNIDVKNDELIKTLPILSDFDFSNRATETLYPPNEDYPIGKVVGSNVKVKPENTFTHYIVSGLRYPAPIVYAYQPSSDGRDYVFDASNSVDTDWPEVAHGEIVAIIAKTIGLVLKDQWITQFENFKKQSEMNQ